MSKLIGVHLDGSKSSKDQTTLMGTAYADAIAVEYNSWQLDLSTFPIQSWKISAPELRNPVRVDLGKWQH